MRIIVDRDRCTGLGMCEAEAPDLFEVQDDGSMVVLDDAPSPDQQESIEAACAACPTGALTLFKD